MKKIKIKTYFYGSCDITATATYIKNNNCVFNDYRRFGNYYSFQSDYWVASIFNNEVEHPFVAHGVYPEKSIFNDEPKIVVLTVLCDPLIGNYIGPNKKLIRFGYSHLDATKSYKENYPNEYNFYGPSIFEQFSKDYLFYGMTKEKEIIDNFKIIFNNFNSSNTQFIIFLGPVFDSCYGEKNLLCKEVDMKSIYRNINQAMKSTFIGANIHFIDPNLFYRKPKKQSDLFYYNFPSLIHYPRKTYKKMAKEMHHLFPRVIKYDYLSDIKRFIRKKIRPKLAHLKKKFCIRSSKNK